MDVLAPLIQDTPSGCPQAKSEWISFVVCGALTLDTSIQLATQAGFDPSHSQL